MKKIWTEAEDTILRDNWGSDLPVSLWKMEHRSMHAIYKRAEKLGLSRRNIRMQHLYPQVIERADKIMDFLRQFGPQTTNAIKKQLGLSESLHRRAHDLIRKDIYIFGWAETKTGPRVPIWAIGDAPDMPKPPKVMKSDSDAKYRMRQRARKASNIKPGHARTDFAASWLFNPTAAC